MTTTHDIGGLALGTGRFRTAAGDAALAVLDAWRTAGGRLIDTASVYGHGQSETVIGGWLRTRGARDDVVLLTKGAHPDERDWSSRVTPEIIASDLVSSLDRLGVPAVDIYLVHRDRPEVPVGEIVDALAAEVSAGRARSIGVSNWTLGRLDAAIAYADLHGLPPIAWSSPSLALARPVDPPWPGTVDAGDEASRSWYATHTTRLEVWSPTANGYFAADADLGSSHLRAYRTPANEARRARAAEFGAARGLSGIQVALAWVINQPSRPVAAIGMTKVEHVDEAVAAARTTLTESERDWLEHGEVSGGASGAPRQSEAAAWA
jgi:aryl-alcohol dehydrogenase-like predicted oxidoreductase